MIGVRGTDFWGGPIDGCFGVFLLEGAVTVENGSGVVSLERRGAGVQIDRLDARPGPAVVWPSDKVQRAIATVTFR